MIVIIDNYDSFTFNLARYFEELACSVTVFKNDAVTLSELRALKFSHLVLSPGPCTPNESGICLQVIESFAGKIPILGVCLGHQAIAQVFGAKITRAQNIRHGKTSSLRVVGNETTLFKDCPETFAVTRYHSLLVDDATLRCDFEVTATCNTEGIREVMAIENKSLGLYGVQFHPESLLTEYGHQLLKNFVEEG